jgi:two-component system KDP operon response regulator KdpE
LKGIIECGDFKIDLTRRTVAMRGRHLDLTSEEFDVFLFLAGHPHSLITPRTMLSTSWSVHRVRQTEFLRALVSLRNKLDAADSSKRYLRTEPWLIYRFDPTSLATT